MKAIKSKYCRECYPASSDHMQDKINSILDFYLGIPFSYVFAFFPKKIIPLIGDHIKQIIINFSQKINHSKFTHHIDRSQLNNAVLVFWDEAKKRDLNIFNVTFGNRHTPYFVLMHDNKRYYFDRNPIYLLTKKLHHFNRAIKYDNKFFFKTILLSHKLPCPIGSAFISTKKAFNYGMKLGFPLVVKPLISSLSRHVSFNIRSEQHLLNAIKVAKIINYRIIVEQYIPGDNHRVIMLNNELIACAKRQAGRIVGNGKSTVEKLIDEKNGHPLRGKPKQLDSTLHQVEKDKHLVNTLAEQGVTFETKLQKDKPIFLSHKINSANGADITNVTSLIHPENLKLFSKINAILNLPFFGMDFICKDISIPWQQQTFAIIENNSLPYIDIHHYPSAGRSINVAGKIWDCVLNSLKV